MKNFATLFLILILVSGSIAQVLNPISGISGKLSFVEISETYDVALIGGSNNYFSLDQGNTWTAFNNGVGSTLNGLQTIDGAIINDSTYCLIVNNPSNSTYSIVRTNDYGQTWTISNTVAQHIDQYRAIKANDATVIIAAKNGIYRSIDGGVNWSNILLTNNNAYSNFVEFHEGSNTWFLTTYSDSLLASSDQGLTWFGISYTVNPSTNFLGASSLNNQLLLTEKSGNSNRFRTINPSNQNTDVVEISLGLVESPYPCRDAAYLPNNKILAANDNMFYMIDTSNWQLFHIPYPTNIGYAISDLDLSTTYGLAVRYYSPGNTGTAYRIDYTPNPNVFVPASFNLLNENTTCAGDLIEAYPDAIYGDSLKWYVNGSYVSSNLLLQYQTPAQLYTTYTIELHQFYNGIETVKSKTKTFPFPQPPHTYVYSVDTTACYNVPLMVFINPDNGSPGSTMIKVLYGDSLAAGPAPMTYANMYLYTFPITTADTLKIITYKNDPCDLSADTVSMYVTVGLNLITYSTLPYDTILCLGQDPVISLTQTDTNYSYTFFESNTLYTTIWNYPNSGTGLDTLTQSFNGIDEGANFGTSPAFFDPMYTIINLKVQDTLGCSNTVLIDSFQFIRTTAYFQLESLNYYKNDTVHLSNCYVTENRHWTSPNLNSGFISNATDTIPLIVADTTGFFDIYLENEPYPGCTDSESHTIFYGQHAQNLDTACLVNATNKSGYVNQLIYDPFGDLYQLNTNYFGGNFPTYHLLKMDESGNKLWDKHVDSASLFYDTDGIAMDKLTFDCDGNPIVSMWISSNFDYHDDLIDYTAPTFGNLIDCFLIKLDKNTGDTLWRVSLRALPIVANYAVNRWRITDLVVDGDLIHFAAYGHYYMNLITINASDGSYVSHSPFNFGIVDNSIWIEPSYLSAYNSYIIDDKLSWWSPQLEVLSTGEVIAIGHYTGHVYAQPQLDLSPGYSKGIFAFKYHPNNGIYDITKIAELPQNLTTTPRDNQQNKFFIDENDQIIFSCSAYLRYENVRPIILDSTLDIANATFVASMDKNYNLNWITIGTYSSQLELKPEMGTSNFYLLGQTSNNFGIGQDTVNIMVGKKPLFNTNVANFPTYPYTEYMYRQPDFGYIVKFNDKGIPLKGKGMLLKNPVGFLVDKFHMATSPCGDLAVTVRHSDSIIIDSQVYLSDSSMLMIFKNDCTSGKCSWLNLPDTLVLCDSNFNMDYCEYYNVDSVNYILTDSSGLQMENGTFNFANHQFNSTFSLPQTGLYKMTLTNPISDTFYISYAPLSNVTFTYTPTICFGEQLLFESSDSTYAYTWQQGQFSGHSLNLDTSLYTVGIDTMYVNYTNGICSRDTAFIFEIKNSYYLQPTPINICSGDSVFILNQYISSSGVYIDSLISQFGCDSIVEQQVNVHPIPMVQVYPFTNDTICINQGNQSLPNTLPSSQGIFSGNGILNNYFHPTIAGIGTHFITYTYTSPQGCTNSDSTTIHVEGCASLFELKGVQIEIGPNPFDKTISIKSTDQIASVEILNTIGQIVYQQKVESNSTIIDTEYLAKGAYIIRVHSTNMITTTLIKE